MGRIANSIKQYRETFGIRNDNKGALFITDMEEVKRFTQEALTSKGDTSPTMATYLFEIIFNAMEAGFMIGYRCAKREQRKK